LLPLLDARSVLQASRAEFRYAKLVEPMLYEKQKKKAERYQRSASFLAPPAGRSQRLASKPRRVSLCETRRTYAIRETKKESGALPALRFFFGSPCWARTSEVKISHISVGRGLAPAVTATYMY